jgi:GTP-binding protein
LVLSRFTRIRESIKKTKSVFQQFITDYFETREQLVCAFVLIDIRHEAQTIDIEFMSYMGESEIPSALFSPKADKISKVKINSHIAAYKKTCSLTIGLKCLNIS